MNLNLSRTDSEQHGRGTLFTLAAVAKAISQGMDRQFRYALCGQTAGRGLETLLVDSELL